MNKLVIMVASLVALASSAIAADLPSKKEISPPPSPAPLWAGFYAGLNIGGGVGTSSAVQTNGYGAYDPVSQTYGMPWGFASPYRSGTTTLNQRGVVGGGQIGYNYQINKNILIGAEADFQGSSVQGGGTSYGFASATSPVNNVTHFQDGLVYSGAGINWIGTVRARVGYLVTPSILLFGTGGFAYGNTWANVNSWGYHWHPFNPSVPSDIVFPSYQSTNNVSVGWTAGGGAEWMFLQNWSAKVEAIYYNLGSQNVTGQYSPLLNERYTQSLFAFIAAARTNVSYNGVIARAGVNYHFNLGSAPVVAKF
jgi:outer membrane immunogenic protein